MWTIWLALAIGALVATLFGLAAYGASRWDAATKALLAKLEAARLPTSASRYDARELEGLPAPVQRYFQAVLKDGQRIITAVTVEHTGTFNVSQTGEGDIAKSELMRFFAEAAWYPTALLPSQGVRWEAMDDHSANATLVDGKISLKMLFRFNDAGLIESVEAEARGATVGKTIVMTPWGVRISNYQELSGMRVPMTGKQHGCLRR